MPIGNLTTYLPTMDAVIAHWAQCLTAAAPRILLVRLPKNVTVSRAQFIARRDALQAQQITVQSKINDQLIARGAIELQKLTLMNKFHLFTGVMDASYQNTDYYKARPLAPHITHGQLAFSLPMFDAMTLWEKLNAGTAPVGVTLPLVLPDTEQTVQGTFASMVSSLQFAYSNERSKIQDVTLARATRNRFQDEAYEIMKAYRETVVSFMAEFPDLIATLPRLTPLPGHTPEPVNASAVFVAPDKSKIVYSVSTDALLESYQLRACIGPDWNDDDAIVVETRNPGDVREFITEHGLNQPGAQVVFKVFVILNTGNEAGSAPMVVQRPLAVAA